MHRLHSGDAGKLCVRPVYTCPSREAKRRLGAAAILNFIDGKLNPLRFARTRPKTASMYTGKLTCTDAEAPKLRISEFLDPLIG
jgi:hypothetical protein